ncbi:MAG TPA: ribose 5-phosphate isomerase B [bacterium]|nr:ribose 5-phosphate isomerase B [bacterium]
MRIGVGSDHAGFDLKTEIRRHLEKRGIEVMDFGTMTRDSVDYPDYGFEVAKAVARGACDYGVLVCSTGIGISIAANKVKGVRAAVAYNVDVAVQSRAHVDANVLVFGQKFVGPETALAALDRWLETPFEGGRHEKRLKKIIDYEAASQA